MSKVEFVEQVFLTNQMDVFQKLHCDAYSCFWVFDLFLDFILLSIYMYFCQLILHRSAQIVVMDSDETFSMKDGSGFGFNFWSPFDVWQIWQTCRWLDGNAAPCRQSKDGKTARRRGTEAKSKKRECKKTARTILGAVPTTAVATFLTNFFHKHVDLITTAGRHSEIHPSTSRFERSKPLYGEWMQVDNV